MFCIPCQRQYPAATTFCPICGERLLRVTDPRFFRAKPSRQTGVILGNRYEIRGFVGKGAMARVYLAEDLASKDLVAVKVLEPEVAKKKETRDRFVAEAQAVGVVNHENIVRVFDVGETTSGVPYLVMEFLFGETLGDWLRREGTMPLEVGLPLAAQLADAMSAAHGGGIVHRDLKPDNIFLVGEPGQPYAVKVVDFGFAKMTAGAPPAAGARGPGGDGFNRVHTQMGVAIGTIAYMAPEQAVSDPASPRTDIYGLGVVMYRMFTGALPWNDMDDAELMAHQLAVAPPPPRIPGSDARLGKVIMKAIRKLPGNRYASMDQLLEDLERVGGRRPGPLVADARDGEPDSYRPQGSFATTAARFLYKRIRITPPF